MNMARKRRDRGAQFIRSNLELLGFGTRRDALVQAVKELFENALDATQCLGSWDDAPLELLRVSVKLNEDTGDIDIICADTGSGMHAHQITTTSNSDEILHVQLRINPDSEETAVVKKVAHFAVDEDHHHFSGTEMRLSIPYPHDVLDIESAADTLAMYFQSLRYTAPPFVGVQFEFDVGGINTIVDCQHREEPIDRFAADLGASANDVLYAVHNEEHASVSCVALLLGDVELSGQSDIEICLLRYANHTPLINGEDFFLCGITKGVCTWKVWKKYGLQCRRTSCYLVNQLVVTPLRTSVGKEARAKSPTRLVLAIDVCIAESLVNSGIKYSTLKKSMLDICYADGVQTCCRSILQQLADAGRLSTPQQQQDHNLVENFAPLISKSIASIVKQSQVEQPRDVELPHHNHHKQRNMSAIGALRELEKDKKGPNNAGLKELFLNLPTRIRQSGPVKGGINFAVKSWKTSGRWLWVLSTTLLVTLVPLSIEMLREEQTNEVVKELVSKGFSYNQIQGMGYMVSQPESTLAAPAEGAPQ
ncbi:Hypothetical protein PHPALM_19756 [Phytophthora palmivora]|uniref:Uncharacterized protein n=1 Tax=Phytophthora palmivora TaxID=4796 RepID=A0A2P4XGJ7_9STRA|nr:Hypothetical protein PHPALM_19756 [Phytophthora palmivora]